MNIRLFTIVPHEYVWRCETQLVPDLDNGKDIQVEDVDTLHEEERVVKKKEMGE